MRARRRRSGGRSGAVVVGRLNLAGWLFVALVVGVLEIGVRIFELHDTLAAPSATFRALSSGMTSGDLAGEIGTTLESYVQGLGLAIVGGVVLGAVIGSSRTLLDASFVTTEFLRPIPAVAFIPLAIMLFGLGVPMRRFVIAYGALWPIMINTLYGVRGSDRVLHDVAKTSGVGRVGALVRVRIPAALPSIATGIRVSASIALLIAITAEFLSGTDGLGSYMKQQQSAYRLPEMYAAILATGLLGYGINRALQTVEQKIVFWGAEERSAGR